MTTRISPNFRQQILCPQQVSVNTTLTGMDAYKVWTHTVVGSRTFTLPAAKKGAGPMYFCEQQATNVIVVQPQATDNIVGNGAGVPITMNTTGAFLGLFCELDGTWSVISASPGLAGAGTVSSVGLADGSGTPIYNISGSPVTTSGTLTFTFKTQTANTVLAGPTSGGAAQPTFRTLVAADVPSSILPGGFTGFAIPANKISLVANSAGVATTAIRSDATIQLDVGITPTWTGQHIWTAGNQTLTVSSTVTGNTATTYIAFTDAASTRWGYVGHGSNSPNLQCVASIGILELGSNNAIRVTLGTAGQVVIAAPTAGTALTVNSTTNTIWGVDTTNVGGGYLTITISSVAKGYLGVGTTVGGSAGANTISLRSESDLQLMSGGSGTRVTIASAGNVTIAAPSSGTALQVNGIASTTNYTAQVTASSTSGQSLGFNVQAGTTSADVAFHVSNQAATVQYAIIKGDGSGALGPSATLGLSWSVGGNVTIAAPSSGDTLTITSVGTTPNVLLALSGAATNRLLVGLGRTAREAYFGIEPTGGGGIVSGSAAGDFSLSTTAGGINFSISNGGSAAVKISSAGNVTIAAPSSGVALSITGFANSDTVTIFGASTSGQSKGLHVLAGTTSADYAAIIGNQAQTINFLQINGDGSGFLGPSATKGLSWVVGGNITIAVPTSGTTVTATGVASGVVYQATPSATGAGVAFYDNVALTVGLVITSSGSDFSKFQNDGANLWSIATNNALATLGTPVFQWANNGTPKLTGRGPVAAALVDMTPDKGSFTITYTGMTVATTGTAVWVRKGEQVQLHFPAATGTSNVNTFTATGLPTDIQPTRTQILSVPPGGAQNSGSLVASGAGVIVTAASGTATFQLTGSSTGWTASGTKGVLGAFSVAYMLN